MTPFGEKLRELRSHRGIALKKMAHEIGVSPAYLSALEHGKRSRPTWYLVQRIIGYFNIIWDDAEELEQLAQLSSPKVTIDASSLGPRHVELVNRLKKDLHLLSTHQAEYLNQILSSLLREDKDNPSC
jgi:transcriptional regulator with XRE-family HTH domain